MLYEKERELAEQSFQKWVSDKVFSFGWFLMAAIVIVTYVV